MAALAWNPCLNIPRAQTRDLKLVASWPTRVFPNHEWVLLLVLFFEIVVFSITGDNFFTTANAFEITRLSVEVGLLALALTLVIITGGIDLSVGSMMGLVAVVLGALWRDAHLPIAVAAGIALLLGLAGGALNGSLIARFNLPPLIVTLATFSLFRGVAEGITRGIENYSGFPSAFLFLGQGYIGSVIPAQLIVLVLAVAGCAWALHRTAFGRSLYAIGHSPDGARYAGVDVGRKLFVVYLFAGLAASVSAVIYVAHLGQAKSDAGTGFELMAIAAVVLGGTSIFGGRGSVLGTVLGLFAIVVLQNGLRLSGRPAELAGILTGALLLLTVALNRINLFGPHVRKEEISEELDVKNSQVAILSAVILLAALLVAGSNWLLVRSLKQSAGQIVPVASSAPENKKLTVAMMPKAKGDPYFASCRKGAEEAARELNIDLLWDGPTDLDPAKQNEVVEAWITKGVDVIAVSVENQAGISTVLRKAREKGIKVITWDADSEKDARDFLINQATPQGIGYTLSDEVARMMNGRGEFAIVTASLSAANQNEWIKNIRARLAEKYPDLKLVTIQPSDGDRDRAFSETQTILKVYPNVKVIMAIAAPAVPGAAEAVKQAGRTDVKVTGLSLPNMNKPYVKTGVVESVVLWNTVDLGYLTVQAAYALGSGTLKRGDTALKAGRLGTVQVVNDEVRLGAPFIFNKDNIDRFDF